MDGLTTTLSLRTVRAGRLHLSGRILASGGAPLEAGALRVSVPPGFEQSQPLQGGVISLSIPSTGGLAMIRVDITGSTNTQAANWEPLVWSWEPLEAK